MDVKSVIALAAAAKVYAKQVDASVETINRATEIRLRAERRLGELLKVTPKNKGAKPGKTGSKGVPVLDETPTLADAGISKKLSSRAQKIADVPAADFEEALIVPEGEELDARKVLGTDSAHVSRATGVPEWYTPSEYIEAARSVMGGIDLDPASSEVAQRTVKAQRFLSIADDGLAVSWSGRVFLNPPYSTELVAAFSGKLCAHIAGGEVSQAILLTNNATETQWYQAAIMHATALCLPAGRIKFNDETGSPKLSPLQGQSFMYFGERVKEFIAAFSAFGFSCCLR